MAAMSALFCPAEHLGRRVAGFLDEVCRAGNSQGAGGQRLAQKIEIGGPGKTCSVTKHMWRGKLAINEQIFPETLRQSGQDDFAA